MKPLEPAKLQLMPVRDFLRACMADGLTRAEAKMQYRRLQQQRVYLNDIYQVNVLDMPQGVTHLSIKRIDRGAAHDWRHFQQMKNELCGPEREAVEIYPAESRLVDTVNQYHLWVLPPGVRVPFGFHAREVTSAPTFPGTTQRPIGEELAHAQA